MAGHKKRGGHEEEHENHERWLVTYADMVTLLMVLFIVMFAMSQVDQKKFAALKEGLAAGFGESAAAMDGSESILDQQSSVVSMVAPSRYVESLPKDQQKAAAEAIQAYEASKNQRTYAEAEAEAQRLSDVESRLSAALRAQGLEDDVQAKIDERGLVLSLVSKHVVFEPDQAELTPRGQQIVDTLAPVLKELTDPIQIDGHTNQEPVKPRYFASDWELSAARAVNVLRHLVEVDGIPGERINAAAYGHEKPLVDPAEPGSQEVNKRVDIVVLSSLPAEVREYLDEAAAEQNKRFARGAKGSRKEAKTAETAEAADAEHTDTADTDTADTAGTEHEDSATEDASHETGEGH